MSDLSIQADEDTAIPASGAAARMRAAREAAGMTLKDIADTTRVPLRHLAALEEGNFDALPGTTYCAGFARAYARAVGLDEKELVAQLRGEIEDMGGIGSSGYEFEEAVNPARIPPRWLAWASALIVLILVAGYGVWRMQLMTPQTDDQIAAQSDGAVDQAAQQGPAGGTGAPPAAPTGPVVMTAADDVWIRIYQADGTRLYEGTLKRGESYTVPDNARDPMILTGRPDALAVTVGGQAMPPLGPAERTISDVPVSAAALLARAQQPAAESNASAPDNAAVPPVAPPAARRTAPRPAPAAAPSPAAPDGNSATP